MQAVLITTIYLLGFILLIYRIPFFKTKGIHRLLLPAIFFIKFLVGMGLAGIYTYHYPDRQEADIFKYYDDGKVLSECFRSDPPTFFGIISGTDTQSPEAVDCLNKMDFWYRKYDNTLSQNDNHIVIRINALIHLISFHTYPVHILFMSFLSFIGLFLLFRIFQKILPEHPHLMLAICFMPPSLLLWTSGILKETILFFGMGTWLYALSGVLTKQPANRTGKLFLLLISTGILIYIKIYVLLLLTPIIAVYIINKQWRIRRPLISYLLLLGTGMAAFVLFNKLFPEYSLLEVISRKQKDFFNMATAEKAGSMIYIPQINGHYLQLIKAIPVGLFNVIFQPLQLNAPLRILAAAENLALLLFPLMAWKYPKQGSYHKHQNIIWACFSFVFMLYILIGISTPVAGSVVRYKIPALLFYLFGFLLLTDFNKIKNILYYRPWKKQL